MSQEAYRKNKDLTAAARVVFGDIVACAYAVAYHTPEKSTIGAQYKDVHAQYRERMFKALSAPDFSLNNETLRFDCLTFIIRFTNGNCVSFTNSEWASMTKVDLDSPKYIQA